MVYVMSVANNSIAEHIMGEEINVKGKTVSLIQSGEYKALFKHIFKKHIVDSLGLGLNSFMAPPVTRFLSPACRDTRINGLFEELDPSDITDHLPTLFCEVLKSAPQLVVELGTRGGDSTKALLKAASLSGAKMLSVDIDDCSAAVNDSGYKDLWRFVQADDVAFAGEFRNWCEQNGFPSSVDVLFIDTSHEYAHTLQEIKAWFPLLSDKGKVIFHDTHMGIYFKRKNGCIVKGWDNNRGVIRAIEETLGRTFDETVPFIDLVQGWLVEHQAHSNGLTILTRVNHG